MSFDDLPAVNATLNGCAAVFLSFGFYFIKRKRVTAHRSCMIGALVSSTLFLTSYLTYHAIKRGHVTEFHHPEWFKPIYIAILISHIVLAVVILPMIAITLTRALRERFDRHKAIARWTWPLWMYVSVTGVLIYFLLYKIFGKQ